MSDFGDYQLLDRLGAGGMGEVFLARLRREQGFEKQVVIKRILPHLARQPQFREMFLNEARLCASLSHKNVTQVFDFGEVDDSYYLAMEHVRGPDLRFLLDRAAGGTLRPGPAHAVKIGVACCSGLDHAHKRRGPDGEPAPVIHRDVSPRNVLLSYEGEVKLCDFGLARAVSAELTDPGVLKGKYSYMSPEHVQGKPLDARSDLFSLGAVLYEVLTGRQAFPADGDIREVLDRIAAAEHVPLDGFDDVPAPIARVVEAALAADPADRPPDARALAEALERAAAECGQEATTFGLSDLVRALFPGHADRPSPSPSANTEVAARPFRAPARGDSPAPGAGPGTEATRNGRPALWLGLVLTVAAAGLWLARPTEEPPPPRPAAVRAAPAALAPAAAPAAALPPVALTPPAPKPAPATPPAKPTPQGRPKPAEPGVGLVLRIEPAGTFLWDGSPRRGRHRARLAPGGTGLVRAGDQAWFQTLRLTAGAEGDPSVTLTADSRPYATVTLDGAGLGPTPVSGQRLRAGAHRLTFTAQDGQQRVVRLKVEH